MLDFKRALASRPKTHSPEPLLPLTTPWGQCIVDGKVAGNDVLSEHPHPQFARKTFTSLNGWWEYAIVDAGSIERAGREWESALPPEHFDGRILVPFSPETLLSGVDRQVEPHELLWYRRRLILPDDTDTDLRLILHFEAVDYCCSLLVNGTRVCAHRGGYLPFALDLTTLVHSGENTLALCVWDPSDCGTQLRGKQRLQPTQMWYTAQSGIWQSVWLEAVPACHIEGVSMSCDADTGTLTLVNRLSQAGSTLTVRVFGERNELVAMKRTPVGAAGDGTAQHATTRTLSLQVPDTRRWSPDDPFLYRLELSYGPDMVDSYCAFRSIEITADADGTPRLFLNHKPLFLRGVLDQGYWPESLMTPPADAALEYDIRTMKDLGFNLLRKHIKRESDRFYYHCDRLGMLVWQDMVSGGGVYGQWQTMTRPTLFRASWTKQPDDIPEWYGNLSADDPAYRREWEQTCRGLVKHLRNHPCVVGWTLFNEGWGQFDSQRAVQEVRGLDPTRPISATSGWYDQGGGDFSSVHNYFRPLSIWRDPLAAKADDPDRGSRVRTSPRALVLSEFGGFSWHEPDHCQQARDYGYQRYASRAEWQRAVEVALAKADALEKEGLAGFVFTQLSDVQEETNGILTCDRRVNKLG
ncbi:MAG: glycoside hydrolase family 2 protein [Eggerthellaceae bacterium]|jgi:beta-galactosidase/beta-glucuronidase